MNFVCVAKALQLRFCSKKTLKSCAPSTAIHLHKHDCFLIHLKFEAFKLVIKQSKQKWWDLHDSATEIWQTVNEWQYVTKQLFWYLRPNFSKYRMVDENRRFAHFLLVHAHTRADDWIRFQIYTHNAYNDIDGKEEENERRNVNDD